MASAAPLSEPGTSCQERTTSITHPSRLALLARSPSVDHHQRLAFEHGLAVDRAVARQGGAGLVGIERGDLERRHHYIADEDRPAELHGLRKINAARTG